MISIIIPTFNRPHKLARALACLQAQRAQRWEALVIDDGQGDGLRLAEALQDPRIRAHANPGRGQVQARNFALTLARGAQIALLDDDDWWEDPLHIDKVLAVLDQREDVMVYRTGWLVREDQTGETRRWAFDLTATPLSLRENNTVLGSSIAYPRKFHDVLGPFDNAMPDYWDWDWYLRVSGTYALHGIADRGVAIGIHGQNQSYATRQPEREAALQLLCTKHGLVDITLKDHLSLVQ